MGGKAMSLFSCRINRENAAFTRWWQGRSSAFAPRSSGHNKTPSTLDGVLLSVHNFVFELLF
jgi:hypothetical protein